MTRTMRAAGRVARREFVERARSRAFLISNAFLLVALVVAIAIPAAVGGDATRRVGYLPAAEQTASLVEQQAGQLGRDVEVVAVPDRAAAEAALRAADGGGEADAPPDGPVDAVLVDPATVLVEEELPDDLESQLRTASRVAAVTDALDDAGLSDAQRQEVLAPSPLTVDALDPPEEAEEGPALFVGAIAVFALYGLLVFYGQFVAQGVIEEKSSRVVEVLLSAVRPIALLYGKILGLTALGLLQVAVLIAVALVAAVGLLDVAVPREAYGTVALAAAWFLLGFLQYATLFAVAGALVTSQEDLQSAVLPVLVPLIGGFFVAQFSLQNPDSTVSLIAGLLPFTAPLVQPLRFGAQVVDAWEVPVAVGLSVLTIVVLVPVAARFYAGSVLRFGSRVRLGEAWRTAGS